ncbi:hypothetical protein EW026_g7653 [Hermanssonia centrifuga]|uniref:Uncharacterized protein n=1 Tax=Hermanssonia centrifuga TaxID=98765 RepID=A0A4S4K844_9APHY|nr:hypothetical protein EW026_g7653 [Hermanssonia centrifuga]
MAHKTEANRKRERAESTRACNLIVIISVTVFFNILVLHWLFIQSLLFINLRVHLNDQFAINNVDCPVCDILCSPFIVIVISIIVIIFINRYM